MNCVSSCKKYIFFLVKKKTIESDISKMVEKEGSTVLSLKNTDFDNHAWIRMPVWKCRS